MDQVFSLKKSRTTPQASENDDDRLGIENWSLKWNAVQEEDGVDVLVKPKVKMSSDDIIMETSSETNGDSTDHQFELKDISVHFPDGKLTHITSPTSSGKMALLVCFVSLPC